MTLSQAPVVGRSSSSSTIRPLAQKKKTIAARPIQKARTLPPAFPSSSSASSYSSYFSSSSPIFSSNDELKIRVSRLVPPIICEDEENKEDMASNFRVGFRERQLKPPSKSIVVNPSPLKKVCTESFLNPLSQSSLPTTAVVVASELDDKPPSTDDISYHETRELFFILENINEESFECSGSPLDPKPVNVPSQEKISELLKRIHSFTEREPPVQNIGGALFGILHMQDYTTFETT